MCNLYRMRKSVGEVARLFDAGHEHGANVSGELYPGYPGLVVAGEELRAMTWGFPLAMKGRNGQCLRPRPVTNAREDKLHTPFWRDSFMHRRCLIPVDAWAEAEGTKGRMTRTWYGLDGQETFAVAGLWRETQDWGQAYTMVMVDACPHMVDVRDRMPVVLAPGDWRAWLTAEPEVAFALCRTTVASLTVDRTRELWAGGAYLGEEPQPVPDDTMSRLL